MLDALRGGARAVVRSLGFGGRGAPILAYHAVTDRVDPRYASMAVTPADFERQLAWLHSAGYVFLTTSAYVDALRNDALPELPVVLTFDDALRDVLERALPALLRHGATATMYVPTAHVGGTSRWAEKRGDGERPLLDWDGVREVAAAGVEIGGHGHSHRELDRLPPTVVRDEVLRCKAALDEATGTAARSFAYPYGRHRTHVRAAVRAAGFDSACEVRRLPSSPADDPYALRRMLVTGGMSDDAFAALVRYRPSRADRLTMEAKAFAARLARRARGPRQQNANGPDA